jgi:hypothetical protein
MHLSLFLSVCVCVCTRTPVTLGGWVCQGVDAVMVNLCRVIERAFDARHLNHEFYAYLREAIVHRTRTFAADHRRDTQPARPGPVVPVVTGASCTRRACVYTCATHADRACRWCGASGRMCRLLWFCAWRHCAVDRARVQ